MKIIKVSFLIAEYFSSLKICKTRRVRRRNTRRAETTIDTDESDSDMDQPASSRTESSNQLDINLKNKSKKLLN